MSMYGLFKTDGSLENSGVIIDYGSFRVTLARAGGSNKKYIKSLESKVKPYKRAIQTDTLDADRQVAILREVYAEAVVLNWEVKNAGKFVQGIESPEGEILGFNKENVIDAFSNLPDLFQDIQEQASKASLFRQDILEEDSGNL